MNRNFFDLLLLAVVLSTFTFEKIGHSHGVPIDLLANSVTGKLFYFENFDPAELELQASEIIADNPGFGVNFPANGISTGTSFELDVTQSLLFWDGTQLAIPSVSIQVINPSFSDIFTVTANSGEQTGLFWGEYAGTSFWHADGIYLINSSSAPTGIYGLGLRVSDSNSSGYGPSKPLLLPLVYDPNSQLSATQIEDGIAALHRQLIVPASADFDGDSDVDGADFLAWVRGHSPGKSFTTISSDGDADGDSDVDFADLQFWSRQFGNQSTAINTVAVPELPTINYLSLFIFLTLSTRVIL